MPAERFTKKANTKKRKRMWDHVYQSMKRSHSVAAAIKAANAAVARDFSRRKKK